MPSNPCCPSAAVPGKRIPQREASAVFLTYICSAPLNMSPEKVMACIVIGHIVYIQKRAGITAKRQRLQSLLWLLNKD